MVKNINEVSLFQQIQSLFDETIECENNDFFGEQLSPNVIIESEEDFIKKLISDILKPEIIDAFNAGYAEHGGFSKGDYNDATSYFNSKFKK